MEGRIEWFNNSKAYGSASAQTLRTLRARSLSSRFISMRGTSAGQLNTRTFPTTKKSKEVLLQKLSGNHEATSDPIRCGQEYSILKTASLPLCSRYHLSASCAKASPDMQRTSSKNQTPVRGTENSLYVAPHHVATGGELTTVKGLVDIRAAAQFLAVSVSTLYGWVWQRRISFVKVGRAVRFDMSDLQRFVEDNRISREDCAESINRTRALLGCELGRQRIEKEPKMGIYKRGRVWWLDYYDQQHNRVQESSHSSSRREAEKFLFVRKSAVARGNFKLPVKITFAEYGKRYMDYAKANKRSWLRDQEMLKHLQAFFGAQRELSEIAPAEIEGYKIKRLARVSGSTVNRELALLKCMFNLATDWDLFQGSNPVCKVKFFRELNIGTRVVSPEEEERLIRNAAPFIQDLMLFALNTGLRVGEIFTLRWSHVDLEKNLLNVFAPKTGKTRTVPTNAEARKVLDAWALGRKNEFVFYNHGTGKPYVDLKAGFALACKKAGISGVTWHTLRHTFASRLAARGVDIVTVQQLLGHSTIALTMRYVHTGLESKRAAVAKLAECGDDLVRAATPAYKHFYLAGTAHLSESENVSFS
jgi:excisionase family DNA binding protein